MSNSKMWKFPQDVARELAETAKKLVQPGKGILAADESTGTIKKRFDKIGVENSEENRARYRTLLFTTPELEKHISGVILYEETLFQKSTKGQPMVDLLKEKDIIPGIKVDMGLADLWGTFEEKATLGLDGLSERCEKYYKQGARFAKWRTVLSIDPATGKPSDLSINETAKSLARYASICQKNRLVPIVEPEILTDGSWDIDMNAHFTEKTLAKVFLELHNHHVLLEGCLLKPNMVTPGAECPQPADPQKIAFYTVRTLNRTVPPALPGVCFLSGGQSEETASLNLNAMNQIPHLSWKLTFSYGRALQASALAAWKGSDQNIPAAQKILLERAQANGLATLGKYTGGAGGQSAQGSLFETNYAY